MVMPFFFATCRISRARWTVSDEYRGAKEETYAFWNTFSNDGNRLDLRELHELHGRGVDTSRRGKVDDSVDFWVLCHCFFGGLVDWQKSLAGSPVHLADELTAKGVDDTSYRWCRSLAHKVKVEHALYGTWLQTAGGWSALAGQWMSSRLTRRSIESLGGRGGGLVLETLVGWGHRSGQCYRHQHRHWLVACECHWASAFRWR